MILSFLPKVYIDSVVSVKPSIERSEKNMISRIKRKSALTKKG